MVEEDELIKSGEHIMIRSQMRSLLGMEIV